MNIKNKSAEKANVVFVGGHIAPIEENNMVYNVILARGGGISVPRWGDLVNFTSESSDIGTLAYQHNLDLMPVEVPSQRKTIGRTPDGKLVEWQQVEVPLGTQDAERAAIALRIHEKDKKRLMELFPDTEGVPPWEVGRLW